MLFTAESVSCAFSPWAHQCHLLVILRNSVQSKCETTPTPSTGAQEVPLTGRVDVGHDDHLEAGRPLGPRQRFREPPDGEAVPERADAIRTGKLSTAEPPLVQGVVIDTLQLKPKTSSSSEVRLRQ